MPTAGRSRPPESRSRVASSLARTTGCRTGRTMTLVPNSMFLMREAMKAMKVTGSRRSSRPAMRSLSQMESMSRASQRSMKSKMEAGVIGPKGQAPRPMPMRTFMGLPL